jgi:hypothetical protein
MNIAVIDTFRIRLECAPNIVEPQLFLQEASAIALTTTE